MLAVLGFGIVIVFMVLVMTKRMSAFTSLMIVPTVFGIIGGLMGFYPLAKLGKYMYDGIQTTSNTGIMLLFAILFFSIMLDAGVFDPVTKGMVKFAKGDPVKVLIGAAILAGAVSMNGDATTTILITCSAFIPVFDKLKMNKLNLAVVIILMNSVLNLLPWGGPTARIIAALHLDEGIVFRALIPGMAAAFIWNLAVAVILGIRERKRLGIRELTAQEIQELTTTQDEGTLKIRRPKNVWINGVITIAVIALLMTGWIKSVIIFAVGLVLALVINYPSSKEQKERISENAGNAVQVVELVFAAGIFMGILTGTGMANGIAYALTYIVPKSFASHWNFVIAVLSGPGTFFLSNDAFYYGVLPVLAQAGKAYGFTALQMGLAATVGQSVHLLSPLVAAIYLLIQMTGVDMGKWQKESAKWSVGIFVIYLIVLGVTGSVVF